MYYRKKPVTVRAIQWTGENILDIMNFMNYEDYTYDGASLFIETLEGNHFATVGDYIIKGVKGEFYPCKPDIFHMTYDKVVGNEFT